MLILFQKRLKIVLFSSKSLVKKGQGDSHRFVNFDWPIILALLDMQIKLKQQSHLFDTFIQ